MARAPMALLCLAIACGGGAAAPGGASVGGAQGGGTRSTDAGTPAEDGGLDAGSSGNDGGFSGADGGSSGADGGAPAADAGPPDGGGGLSPDAGSGTRTITVILRGTGSGRVISTPAGIDCGATCSASFDSRSSVTLIEVADVASTFDGWVGACSGIAACVVAGGGDTTVEATFEARPPQQISVAISPPTATVSAGSRQQFSATVSGTADAAVLWSVREGASGGSVDASGLYLAPSSAGTFHVVATSRADPSRSAAAVVTVTSSGPTYPARLDMAAFDSTLSVGELSLDATGKGSRRIGKLSLSASAGTVEIDGVALPAIAFERQPFAAPSTITAYELVSVAADRMYLLWIYCVPGATITQLWVESTAGEGLTSEIASGSCTDVFKASTPRLRAPAVSMSWPSADRGFSVSGTAIDLPARAPGTVQYDGVKQVAFHFATVDCSFCGGGGWYELHSLLWNPQTSAVTFGIFYLMIAGGPVLFEYTLSMPVLGRGPAATYTASWSRSAASSAASLVMATPMPMARPFPEGASTIPAQ